MRQILILSIVLLSWSGLPAQTVSDSVFEREGLTKLTALLNLKPDDIKFRSDYTDPDSFRLATVAELMNSPYGMISIAGKMQGEVSGPDLTGALRFAFDNLRNENQTVRNLCSGAGGEMDFRGVSLFYSSLDLNRLLMKTYTCLYDIIPAAVDSTFLLIDESNKSSLIREYKELILEDTAEENMPVDVLDSIQKAEEKYIQRFVEFGYKIRKDFLLDAGIETALAMKSEIDLLQDEIESGNISVDQILSDTTAMPSRLGIAEYLGKHKKWKIGGPGDDHYVGDYHFILDFGGNDRYDLSYDPLNPHAVIIIDLNGNDIYNSVTDFTIGGGCMNVSLLFDMAGDDIYNGKNYSIGSGYFGFGLLYDESGGDRYMGDTHVEGAALFGIGIVLEGGGHDSYSAAYLGQGVGMTQGCGLIVENDGNDNYFAGGKYKETYGLAGDNLHYLSLSQGFGYGSIPYMSGGIGAIVDFRGKDNYVSDIYGQGSSYWWSLGLICDSSGNDQYISFQYAQGAGIHMSLGFLFDESGDDFYRGKGLMQGCGHDYGCGFILDRKGNDIYQAESLSQAGGQANGIGILIDSRGDDAYYVLKTENTQGYGNPRRDFGSIGLFLDLGGNDIYSGNGSNNAIWNTGSKWGGGMDWEIIVQDTGGVNATMDN